MKSQQPKPSAHPSATEHAPSAISSAPLRLPYLIGRMDRIVKRRLGEALSPHGLSVPQFTALSVLQIRGPSSNAHLAERSFITPQASNEVVKAMEANGWIIREPDPVHGRIVLLSLTDSARLLLAECQAAVAAMEREMLAGISADHEALLRDLLMQCTRNLR